jgi:hypothetical protein
MMTSLRDRHRHLVHIAMRTLCTSRCVHCTHRDAYLVHIASLALREPRCTHIHTGDVCDADAAVAAVLLGGCLRLGWERHTHAACRCLMPHALHVATECILRDYFQRWSSIFFASGSSFATEAKHYRGKATVSLGFICCNMLWLRWVTPAFGQQ